jgi:hypothetical protein
MIKREPSSADDKVSLWSNLSFGVLSSQTQIQVFAFFLNLFQNSIEDIFLVDDVLIRNVVSGDFVSLEDILIYLYMTFTYICTM